MKKKSHKAIVLLSTVFCLSLLLGAVMPAAAASSIPESTEPDSVASESASEESIPLAAAVPNTVVIKLGPGWAATEFELTSEAGTDPQVIRVSPEGTLTLDLDGSYIYTLTMDAERSSIEGAPDGEVIPDDSSPSDSAPADDSAPAPEGTDDTSGSLIPGIPNLHLFLFGGGLLVCIGALITMAVLKRRRAGADYDSDDDDDYGDE